MLARCPSVCGALALVALCCAPAAAQSRWTPPESPPTEDALVDARESFGRGLVAVEGGRWHDALREFERSYALSGVGASLYNVATALRALGRHLEAREALQLLLERHPEIDDRIRGNAEAMLREVSARVAVLEVLGVPPTVTLLLFDGRHVGDDRRPVRIETDEGHHHLTVQVPRAPPFTWEGSLAPGERRRIEATFDSRDASAAPDAGEAGSPLPYIVIAVGAVALAGIVVGFVLWPRDGPQPMSEQVIRL